MSPPEGSKNGSQTSVLNVDLCLIKVWSLQQRANRRVWASSHCRPNHRLSLSEEHVTLRRSTAVKTHSQSLWKRPRVFLKDSPVPDAITLTQASSEAMLSWAGWHRSQRTGEARLPAHLDREWQRRVQILKILLTDAFWGQVSVLRRELDCRRLRWVAWSCLC